MTASYDKDDHGIIEAMTQDGSFIDGQHIVYKDYTMHGTRYLKKDDYLKQPGVADNVSRLLALGIKKDSIIIAPETSSEINLGQMVAQISESTLVPTIKVNDIHTFEATVLDLLNKGRKIIGIDDISNNGRTIREIQEALQKLGFTLNEFRVMADRNPEISSGITDLQFIALASVQMEQWVENEVPEDLKAQVITTKLGNGRRWVGNMSTEMFKQRLHKENLGFYFDDGKKVIQMGADSFILEPR